MTTLSSSNPESTQPTRKLAVTECEVESGTKTPTRSVWFEGRTISWPSRLAARLEPFDSYWQAPDNPETGYRAFARYYQHNFLSHLPGKMDARILVVSCGPGYLVDLLAAEGYRNVIGIDSDRDKVAFAIQRGLDCRPADAFSFVADHESCFDAIVCEQELNHLTIDEMVAFLTLCRRALHQGGTVIVYGLNGANPLVGAENLAHNIDHFNTFSEHSLEQVLTLAGFEGIRLRPLKLYVFWTNPLNYIGLVVTSLFHMIFRASYLLYGKKVRILTKKIAAVAVRPNA